MKYVSTQVWEYEVETIYVLDTYSVLRTLYFNLSLITRLGSPE